MTFHVIIAAERRASEGRSAISVGTQLHSMGDSVTDINDAHLLYIAEWDLVSPYVTVHKGNIANLKMAYAGWPTITKDEFDRLQGG